MSTLPTKPIPKNYQRIVLVNPTRYLGNLLLAGGLIQDFHHYCKKKNISFLLVIDESYKELLENSLPAESLLFYPRKKINTAGFKEKLSAYLSCLNAIRAFKADIAFNIEEDSVSHRLTQLSKAKFKLGCNTNRHKYGYDHVLSIRYLHRPLEYRHRWFGFAEVFSILGMQKSRPKYLQFSLPPIATDLLDKLTRLGLNFSSPLIAFHTGAAKDFKRWPGHYFAELITILNKQNWQVVLIGAGEADQKANKGILEELNSSPASFPVIDLCNQLTLFELASFFTQVNGMVGNDSGPFHLASALNIPGCVIFGPTEVALWRPLSENTVVLKGSEDCAPECTKTGCIYGNRCLKSIHPEKVSEQLFSLIEQRR